MTVDVAGFCPMGCGTTLTLMCDGHIACKKLTCPSPFAVSQILMDQETEHLVTFTETSFTVTHPLRERVDTATHGCTLPEYVEGLDRPPVEPGVYRALEVGGDWIWAPTEQGANR